MIIILSGFFIVTVPSVSSVIKINIFSTWVAENVIKKFNEWDSQGHKLILVTARKESARSITEKHLTSLGICWDHLIMGVTSGTRVIVNDKLNKNDNDRAIAINVVTDEGFSSIDWSYFDL